jgi:hypothetical protein
MKRGSESFNPHGVQMKLVTLSIVCTLLLSIPALAQDSREITEAQTSAATWLALVDTGKYSESWEQSAALLKSAVTMAAWITAVSHVRGPLGALKSRHLQSTSFTHTLPGAPDGNYVVIKYTTQFENKESAIETVTPLQEKDGTWRVSGYFIK